jgi:hypothetical protein
VAGRFSGSGKIVLQQRIQVLDDMYRRVIPICMGRSIDGQDGEDFKGRVSCHFEIGVAPDHVVWLAHVTSVGGMPMVL